MGILDRKSQLPRADEALPGRAERMQVPEKHFVLGTPLAPPYPDGMETALFGMGCFWGAEKRFWEVGGGEVGGGEVRGGEAGGVYTTAVGYAAGFTRNPLYEEVCSGRTGHNEVVLVVFDRALTSYAAMLEIFWQSHDPTQGMRQGNDVGTQYRSAIYTDDTAQCQAALASREAYQQALTRAGYGPITTEIEDAPEFYFAEAYHQQYLAKNPQGYCGLGGTGVSCPTGPGR